LIEKHPEPAAHEPGAANPHRRFEEAYGQDGEEEAQAKAWRLIKILQPADLLAVLQNVTL
jgi:hypothetical protein